MCVTVPNRNMMDKLGYNWVEIAQNLVYFQPRVTDNLCALARVTKMKLYKLVELLEKDPMVNPAKINAISTCYRLNRVNRIGKDTQAKKGMMKSQSNMR